MSAATPLASTIEAGLGGQRVAVAALAPPSTADLRDFSSRIQLLIERVGGTDALARCCGVTARTVRNWRLGRCDISRGRCLVLARALGIPPLWLMSGEGEMAGDPAERSCAGIDTTEPEPGVDSARLAEALRVLQSYVALTGGSLNIAQRAEAVAELYAMLASPGPLDAGRIVALHRMLAAQLGSNRQTPAA